MPSSCNTGRICLTFLHCVFQELSSCPQGANHLASYTKSVKRIPGKVWMGKNGESVNGTDQPIVLWRRPDQPSLIFSTKPSEIFCAKNGDFIIFCEKKVQNLTDNRKFIPLPFPCLKPPAEQSEWSPNLFCPSPPMNISHAWHTYHFWTFHQSISIYYYYY